MEENNLNSTNQMEANNSAQEQIKPNKSSNKMLIILIVLIIVGACGYFIYTKFIQKTDTNPPKDNNTQEQNNNAIGDVSGTYYNSDYSDVYFTLNSDNTAVVVASSCSDGVLPARTVAYKVEKTNGRVLLSIDINNNQKFEETYTGEEYNNGYRFKPNSLGCTENENTYYVKK